MMIESKINEIERKLKELEKRITFIEKIIKTKRQIFKKKTSILGLLIQLKEEGFFTHPRTLREIIEELAKRGYHYEASSLTNPLQRALKQRILGRIKIEGKWAYVQR